MGENVLGRFVWYELMTTDPKGAEDFYTRIIGWGTTPFEGIGMPYTMWTRGETPIGGLMALPDEARKAGAPPHWMMYVGTPGVDDTVKKAAGLGATVIVPPSDIPNVGRFSVLGDRSGAAFAVYTSSSSTPRPPEADPQPGDFSWHELLTLDHESAFAFYHALFGWDQMEMYDMGPMGYYRIFGRNGRQLGGMFNKPAELQAPPHWMLYVLVDDVHRGVEDVKKHGGQVLNGPMEVPGGDWIAQCLDPQGAVFALHHRKKS